MPVSPLSSAQYARQVLANRLHEIRLDAGLTSRALATAAGWHESKCSRVEHAKTLPSDTDIHTWCDACGASDQAADLIATARDVDSMYIEWRRMQRTGLRHLQQRSVPLYQRTHWFRTYHPLVVPGFLQTRGYAAALLGAITAFRGIPNDVDEAVAARAARSQILYEGNRRVAVVVEESVLRYQIGDTQVMAGQLGHLLSVMSLPSVMLGVIPFTTPQRPMWPAEGFTLFDESEVDVELLSAQITVTQPREITLYTKAFGEFAGLAVYGAQARTLITRAIEALDTPT